MPRWRERLDDLIDQLRLRVRDLTAMEAPAGVDQTVNPPAAARPGEHLLVREGTLVRLRTHGVANRPAFQRWYADEEIARLLRHDQQPLNAIQSRGYFDTIIMPLSAAGMCFAIHEAATDRLIGASALTDVKGIESRSALFRIVIGEKEYWDRGYGTEATRLIVEQAFTTLDLGQIRLEVFRHNARAIAVYEKLGFRLRGQHVETVGRERFALHVFSMTLDKDDYQPAPAAAGAASPPPAGQNTGFS